MIRIARLQPQHSEDMLLVRELLFVFIERHLGLYYPDIGYWYHQKVLPGFAAGNRIIHVVWDGQIISGVSILKLAQIPSKPDKISSFYLLPTLRRRGIGAMLMQRTLEASQCKIKAVLITVPEERLAENTEEGRHLAGFLSSHNFRRVASLVGKYRPGKLEYVLLRDPAPLDRTSPATI